MTMPAPHHLICYRPDALHDAQPAVLKHWRHSSGDDDNNYHKNKHVSILQQICNFGGSVEYVGICNGTTW